MINFTVNFYSSNIRDAPSNPTKVIYFKLLEFLKDELLRKSFAPYNSLFLRVKDSEDHFLQIERNDQTFDLIIPALAHSIYFILDVYPIREMYHSQGLSLSLYMGRDFPYMQLITGQEDRLFPIYPSCSVTNRSPIIFAHFILIHGRTRTKETSNGQEEQQFRSLISSSSSPLLPHQLPTHLHNACRCGKQCKEPPPFLSSYATLKSVFLILRVTESNWC